MWQRHERVLRYQRRPSLPRPPAQRLLHGREWHCGLRHAFANANRDSNSYAYADSNTNGDSYCYRDLYSDSYSDSDSHCNGYSHSYCYCYTDAYFHTETNPDAKRYGFAKAAANSAAAAVGPAS